MAHTVALASRASLERRTRSRYRSHLHQGSSSIVDETYLWYRRDTRWCSEDIFGESYSRSVTTSIDYGSVPRGDGNVGSRSVGTGFPDGVSDDRSSLKATSFSGLICFPFGCPCKRVGERVRGTGSKVHAG